MSDCSEKWSPRLERLPNQCFALSGIVESEPDIKTLIGESDCRSADNRIRAASAQSSPIGRCRIRHGANWSDQSKGTTALQIRADNG